MSWSGGGARAAEAGDLNQDLKSSKEVRRGPSRSSFTPELIVVSYIFSRRFVIGGLSSFTVWWSERADDCPPPALRVVARFFGFVSGSSDILNSTSRIRGTDSVLGVNVSAETERGGLGSSAARSSR